MTTKPRVKPTCAYCGGGNILFDAVAQWDEEKQEHVMIDTHDGADCEDCEGETTVSWVPLEDTPEIDTHLIETFDNMDELQPLVTSIQRSNAS